MTPWPHLILARPPTLFQYFGQGPLSRTPHSPLSHLTYTRAHPFSFSLSAASALPHPELCPSPRLQRIHLHLWPSPSTYTSAWPPPHPIGPSTSTSGGTLHLHHETAQQRFSSAPGVVDPAVASLLGTARQRWWVPLLAMSWQQQVFDLAAMAQI
jgi:hypothetical protein